jgi:hypothetical protein
VVRGLPSLLLVLLLAAPPPRAAAAPEGRAGDLPAAALAAVGRGLACLARDDAAGALLAFDAATAAAPDAPDAWHGRGAALVRLGRGAEARTALKRALALCADAAPAGSADGAGCYEVRLDLAVGYLVDGNRVWAARTLAPAPPADRPELAARRDALLGLALVETDRGDDALRLLAPAEESAEESAGEGGAADGPAAAAARDPELAAWRALVLGRAQLGAGRVHDALRSLARVDRFSPDGRLRDAADDLRDLAFTATDPEPDLVSASAATGVEFDSNALFDPDEGAPASRVAAGRSFVRAALTLRPVRTGAHRLAGDASFFRSLHFGNDEARQLDLTEVAASLRWAWRFALGATDNTVQLRYLFALDLLEGGALLPEPDRFVFLESHGGEASWLAAPTDTLELRLSYTFQRRLFAEQVRDAWLHQLTGSQTLLLADGRVRLTTDLAVRLDDADGQRYDLAGLLLGARAAVRIPWELEVFARASYAWHDYFACSGARTDHLVDVAGGLGRAFLDGHLTVAAQYRHGWHGSSLPAFDYARHVVTLTVGGGL